MTWQHRGNGHGRRISDDDDAWVHRFSVCQFQGEGGVCNNRQVVGCLVRQEDVNNEKCVEEWWGKGSFLVNLKS